jgi:signal transduction histidine kinase
MNSRKTKSGWLGPLKSQGPFVTGVLVSALALAVVAFLQYRWTTRVSEATEVRMGGNLQSTMLDWHLDFYRDFAAICMALQVGPDSGAQDGWNAYAQRYADWGRSSGAVDPVKNVYIWEASQGSRARFLRMNANTARIEAQNPPAGVNRLLARLTQHSSSLEAAMHAWELNAHPVTTEESSGRGARSDTMTGWQFDSTIPAVVHPIIHHANPFEDPRADEVPKGTKSDTAAAPIDWIIVTLDQDAIEQRILPSLAQRYFADQEDLDYEVAVVSGGTNPTVLYSSDARFRGDGEFKADATMNIFGPPPESTEGHFWQAVKRGEYLRSQDWHRFSAPVWFPVIQYAEPDQPWTLMVRRRGDPLGTLMRKTRYRNLAISGGVFLMLAISMGMTIVASQRARKLAQLQMDFVASVSHELKTPLTVICSAAENIVDGVVGSGQRVAQYGSVIRNQGRQLAALVDQVLLFAATQDGKMRYQLRPVSVPALLQTVLANTATVAERARVTVHKQIADNLPEVMADPAAISQCLQNLVMNAIKYCGEKGWVGVQARLETSGEAPEVVIHVEDHGIGIDSAELQRIFEPFYRSPRVAGEQIHGTGLGLPLAKRLAEAMGGKITVRSRIGQGSIFSLHLPAAPFSSLVEPVLVEQEPGSPS